MAVTVDMLVDRDVFRGSHEGHLGRVEGILDVEFELNDELFPIIQRVPRPGNLHFPDAEIT